MNTILKASLCFFSLSLLPACQAKDSTTLINLEAREFSSQLSQKKDLALLIDVRTPEEFQSGHIQGALSIDFNAPNFAENLAKLPKDKEIYVYCRSGSRSKASAPQFISAGFKKVNNLTKGIIGWQALELPVTLEPTPNLP
jgi:rhodanese-related sulfurtransferase